MLFTAAIYSLQINIRLDDLFHLQSQDDSQRVWLQISKIWF